MSSTNRGGKREASDYYVTPVEEIVCFLGALAEVEPVVWSHGLILDPCAGGDAIRDMSYPVALRRFGVTLPILTLDLRQDSRADVRGVDYLQYTPPVRPRVIITNPPFALADAMVRKALSDVDPDGWVIMLLRLNFLGGVRRLSLWRQAMPKWIFVHPRRLSFTEDGKTDSIEYAHFCWTKQWRSAYAMLKFVNRREEEWFNQRHHQLMSLKAPE